MVIALLCGLLGLGGAVFLIKQVMALPTGNERMLQIAGAIQEGAQAYLNRQIVTIGAIAAVIFFLLWVFRDFSTAAGFVLGAICSLSAGYIGMRVAVVANVRTAQGATLNRKKALQAAFNGGAVTGLLVVGLALLSVGIFWLLMSWINRDKSIASLVGVALGASLISVFARLGGGIYTKAADVGADLVGKVESNLEEDDPRNPATIADNVGDNVGDCAGMAADVFETYAVSLIGTVLVGALTAGLGAPVVFPFLLGGAAIIASIIGIFFVNVSNTTPTNALIGGVVVTALICAVLFWPLTMLLFPRGLTAPRCLERCRNDLSGEWDLFFLADWPFDDGSSSFYHKLLHRDQLFAGAQDSGSERYRTRDEHYRRSGGGPACNGLAGALHCGIDLAEPQRGRSLWHRCRRDGDALDVRHHYLARCLRAHHRQCRRHRGDEWFAQDGPNHHRRTGCGRQYHEGGYEGLCHCQRRPGCSRSLRLVFRRPQAPSPESGEQDAHGPGPNRTSPLFFPKGSEDHHRPFSRRAAALSLFRLQHECSRACRWRGGH